MLCFAVGSSRILHLMRRYQTRLGVLSLYRSKIWSLIAAQDQGVHDHLRTKSRSVILFFDILQLKAYLRND